MGFYSGACTNSIRSGLERKLKHNTSHKSLGEKKSLTNLSEPAKAAKKRKKRKKKNQKERKDRKEKNIRDD